MEYSLSSAAKVTGSSKSLIHRMCEDGRLSHRKLPNGQYRIDASELGRAFSEKNPVTVLEPPAEASEPPSRKAGAELVALRTELAVVQAKAEMLVEQLDRERLDRERERQTQQETLDDLRKRLDQEQEERRNLQRQLMPPPRPTSEDHGPAKPPQGLLARLFGRSALRAGA